MRRKVPQPPDHLRAPTATWWRSVATDYELEGHHERLLTLAAEAYDRCQEARETLARDGLTIGTADGGLKTHPLVAVERDSRLAFARLVRELDLDCGAPAPDSRPPALRSNRRGI
jgi:P27 family predicted phage terminase small subunit